MLQNHVTSIYISQENPLSLYTFNMRLSVSILYIVVFVTPIALLGIDLKKFSAQEIVLRSFLALSVISTLLKIKVFPVGNVFTNYGFVPQDIYGIRTQNIIIEFLINILLVFSVLAVSFVSIPKIKDHVSLIPFPIFKSSNSLFLILTGFFYLLTYLFTPTFFDRYTYPLIVVALIFVCLNIRAGSIGFKMFILSMWVIISVFINYNFINQFVISHNIVWNTSRKLVNENVAADEIKANVGWNLYNETKRDKFEYLFSYKEKQAGYTGIETFNVEFPLNTNPSEKIYLLKCVDTCYRHDFPSWEWGL